MTADEARKLRRKTMAPVYAAQRMQALRDAIDPEGRCKLCGVKPRKAKLQIDHVDGRDWTPRNHNQWTRAARYWREFLSGVRMRLLCRKCNGSYRPPGWINNVPKEQWATHPLASVLEDVVPF